MFEVREIQLRLPRDQTAAYTAIMDQYLTNIMLHLKKELTTGDGDVETTLKLWRQYHNTLATVVSPPYLGYTKVEIYCLCRNSQKHSTFASPGESRSEEQSLDPVRREESLLLRGQQRPGGLVTWSNPECGHTNIRRTNI